MYLQIINLMYTYKDDFALKKKNDLCTIKPKKKKQNMR